METWLNSIYRNVESILTVPYSIFVSSVCKSKQNTNGNGNSNGNSNNTTIRKRVKNSYQSKYYDLPAQFRPFPAFQYNNPISWGLVFLEYIWPSPLERAMKCSAEVTGVGRLTVVRVNDKEQQMYLWEHGFFGKGVYSRSEPSWYARNVRRLGLPEASTIPLTSEERTFYRRQERLKFKQERARLEEERLDLIRRREQGEDIEVLEVPEQRELERPVRFDDVDLEIFKAKYWRPEDADLIVTGRASLPFVEYVQLMPYEAIFLSEFMDCLEVKSSDGTVLKGWDLVKAVTGGKQLNEFMAYYAAYHHYRSKGWCTRSGVKFSTDFILYNRGPVFTHAEFAVMVIAVCDDDKDDKQMETARWFEQTLKSRIIGGVKKTMIQCYVEMPCSKQMECIDMTKVSIGQVLHEYFRITDISTTRWIPSKNR